MIRDLSDKAANLELDKSMVDFVFKDSLRSCLEEGSNLEGGFSLGFGSLQAIIFFLFVRSNSQIDEEKEICGLSVEI